MRVKIDTREKFHAITILEPKLAANMTADLEKTLLAYLQNDVKNLVVIMREVTDLEQTVADALVQIQQTYYEQSSSFVVCELKPAVEDLLSDWGLLELMNVTPTESEAWDIVQLEEIERELLDPGHDEI